MTKRKFTLDKKEVCYLLDKTEKTITTYQKLEDDPLPIFRKAERKGQENEYDPRAILQWKIRKELNAVIEIDGEKLNLDEQRARLAKEQSENVKLKNAEKRRELAPINFIEWALGQTCAQISAILESLPLKIKRRVPKLSATDIELIRKEIIKAQNTASKITVDLDVFRDEAGS